MNVVEEVRCAPDSGLAGDVAVGRVTAQIEVCSRMSLETFLGQDCACQLHVTVE